MNKIHNYSAGPCILPQEVFKEASQAVLNFNNSNLSILEMSHRSKDFVAVMNEAQQLVKEMLNIPNNYTVLFLQGGASLGFLIAAYNMLRKNNKASYIETGTWAKNAIKEAKKIGDINVIASSSDKNFSYIPKNYNIPADTNYLHFTSNNTIYGTQFKDFPKTHIPLVCDMSSDIFSRKFDVSKFDLIYAGAQKNLGPAGATLFIVKNEILGKSNFDIPSMLNLKVHADKESMFNTPPVYSIYVSMLNLRYMIKEGGIETQEKKAIERAQMLYHEIDTNPLFEGTTTKEDRSNMNATFLLTDLSYEEKFNQICKEANINGLKGHRSVGGYRASMYNALPIESVEVLIKIMHKIK